MATVKICDVCGGPSDTTDLFAVGRSLDAAGSFSTDTVSLDLCWKHRSMAADKALQALRHKSGMDGYEVSRMVVEAVQYLKKKAPF